MSCGEDPTTEPTPTPPSGPEITKDSVIKLGKNTVNASLSGGKYTLDYTIQNPHAGTKVTASAAEPWVLDFDLTTPNLIQFNVEPNTGDEPRSCLVTVEYRFADPVVFTVKQGARVDKGFSIEKPVGMNYNEVKKLSEVVKETGVKTFGCMCNKYRN